MLKKYLLTTDAIYPVHITKWRSTSGFDDSTWIVRLFLLVFTCIYSSIYLLPSPYFESVTLCIERVFFMPLISMIKMSSFAFLDKTLLDLSCLMCVSLSCFFCTFPYSSFRDSNIATFFPFLN